MRVWPPEHPLKTNILLQFSCKPPMRSDNMTLHIEVPVQVGADIPGRKTSEMPLDNITVRGKMSRHRHSPRHRLGEITLYLIFTKFRFCIILLPATPYQHGYKQAQKSMKGRASRFSVRISTLVKDRTPSETKDIKTIMQH